MMHPVIKAQVMSAFLAGSPLNMHVRSYHKGRHSLCTADVYLASHIILTPQYRDQDGHQFLGHELTLWSHGDEIGEKGDIGRAMDDYILPPADTAYLMTYTCKL